MDLTYDKIPNISLELDREKYPDNSEVFVTINDIQLNQDPTDEDSWTFNIDSPIAVFYQAFDSNGQDAANGGAGLVNLNPFLPVLGFKNNGQLLIDLGNIMELKTNREQPDDSVNNGAGETFSDIVTLVEEGPYSGLLDSGDFSHLSTIGILKDAPRGETGIIDYNDQPISVLTGFTTASVSLDEPTLTVGDGFSLLRPAQKFL